MWCVELVLTTSEVGGICYTLSSYLEYYIHLLFLENYELIFKDVDWVIHSDKAL